MNPDPSPATRFTPEDAARFGRRGGQSTSPAQRWAARRNGQKRKRAHALFSSGTPLRELYAALNVDLFEGRLPAALRKEFFYRPDVPWGKRGMVVRRVGVRLAARGLRDGRAGWARGLFFAPGERRSFRIRVLGGLGTELERRVLL